MGSCTDGASLEPCCRVTKINTQIIKEEPKYIDRVNELVRQIRKRGISADCTIKKLCMEYGKYNQQEIAGAYYICTGKTDCLDDIDYQRILIDDNRPVIQRRKWRDEVRNHAHHICYKKGQEGPENKEALRGHEILREYGIDPVLDPHNLIPSPNTGHCLEEIKRVVLELEKAENEGLEKCQENGLQGEDEEIYIRNMLYRSLEKLGKEAQGKSLEKKGKDINEKKLCRN